MRGRSRSMAAACRRAERAASGSAGPSRERPMFRKPSRPSHATVVAYLALFVALGGSGYAAVEINGGDIKDRTIIAKKVKKDALTGTEIKESKLDRVPSAASAANGSKLGGRP